MRSLLLPLMVAALFSAATCSSATADSGPKTQTESVRIVPAELAATLRFRRVMIVVLENAGYDAAVRQPFLASLEHRGALISNLSAEAHPSLPNYLALVAG